MSEILINFIYSVSTYSVYHCLVYILCIVQFFKYLGIILNPRTYLNDYELLCI